MRKRAPPARPLATRSRLASMSSPLAYPGAMAKVRWARRCSAKSRRTGLQCGAYAMTGGLVCYHHGGTTPVVAAAAARRWAFERMMARIERDMERATGQPVPPLALAWIRAQFAPDPATYRKHGNASERAAWTPRVITPNLAAMAEERRRATA